MAGSLNRVTLLGRLGRDPEIRSFGNGGRLCNLNLATSYTWKDKNGEKKETTNWHTVVIFQEQLVGICEKYLHKGDQVYVEGSLETRKWQDKSGQDRYATEVVLRPFGGQLVLIGGGKGGSGSEESQPQGDTRNAYAEARGVDRPRTQTNLSMDDEVPF